jgi:hypothetical protein
MRRRRYQALIAEGYTRAEACRQAGVSYSWAKAHDYRLQNESSHGWVAAREAEEADAAGGPRRREDLSELALASLEDFALFRPRYCAHVATPWQTEAANEVVRLQATPDKEYVVLNCPPGSGKTTGFTHDLPAWLTVRDRAVRGLLGHHVSSMAATYTGRLRRTLERKVPVQAKDDDRARGLAVDAEATLLGDFGRFKPEASDIWRRDQFIVEQFGETPIDEKESTWTAFGMDSGQLGMRLAVIVWDDLVTKKVVRSPEQQVAQQEWWDDEAETRLEPSGLLMLVGQRLAATDLYAYCRDKAGGDELYDAEEDPDLPTSEAFGRRKYHHIVFKAHYEDRCSEDHRPGVAKPYPEGCLLDPVRVPWRELKVAMMNRDRYRVLFQQEDSDPSGVLAPRMWIDGGQDPQTREYHPGCWDPERGISQLPEGLEGPLVSICAADPSPTQYWAVGWFVVQPSTGQWWMLDLLRRRMDAPEFLEWTDGTRSFSGVMEEWQARSVDLKLPITAWVVEQNAAQRYLLQHEYVRRWQAKWGVRIIGHETHRNKADTEFGVWALLRPMFRNGKLRLPGAQGARLASLKLVDEATLWPDGRTDDCVMMLWMAAHRLPTLLTVDTAKMPKMRRPGWLRGGYVQSRATTGAAA